MRYYIEESLEDFKAWCGGKDTLNKIIELERVQEVENYIIKFKSDFIFVELLGYTKEEVIEMYKEIKKDAMNSNVLFNYCY